MQISDKKSFGFRKLWNPTQGINLTQFYLNSRNDSLTYVLELDIKGAFDNISHDWLLNNIPMNKSILNQWLKCGYIEWENQNYYEIEAGVPQGGIVSPTICNMTLNGIESHVENYLRKFFKIRQTWFGPLIRFADDMIFLCRSEEVANYALEGVKDFLNNRELEIKESKTWITKMVDAKSNFDFLGGNFKRYWNGKVRTTCPKKNFNKTKEKIRTISKKYFPNMVKIISELNDILRG